MRKEKSALTLEATPKVRRAFWRALPPAAVLMAGWAWLFVPLLPSAPLPVWAMALAGAALCAGLLPLLRLRLALPGGILLCALLVYPARSGLLALANDILALLTRKTGRIFLDYAVGNGALWLGPALLWLLLALLTAWTCHRGRVWPLALPLLTAVILALWEEASAPAVLLLAGGVLLLRLGRNRCGVRGWGPQLLLGALALTVALLLPRPGGCWDSLSRSLHALCYDSPANSMPEGQLQDLGAWDPSGAEALAVTMEVPQKLYLRGMTGEVYTGTAWESLEPETLAEAKDTFYWLHNAGLYGQSLISSATAALGEGQPLAMTVQCRSACAARSYLPYALGSSAGLDPARTGDAGAAAGLTEMTYLAGSVPEWFALQEALAARQDEPAVAAYLAGEAAYRSYVKTHDLQLTPEAAAILSREFDEETGARTLGEIQALIRSRLEELLVYDSQATTYNGENDFLTYCLTQGSGYSVHYATAATLMLRYFGVPARYVEGYFLSAEEAARMSAGDTVILRETHAHAWAEYYLDGVGWIPFETTPGYIDQESLTAGSGGDGVAYAQDSAYLQALLSGQPQSVEPERGGVPFRPVWLLWLLPIAVAALLLLCLRRRLRLRRRLKAFDRADDRTAVELQYGYAVFLLRAAGISGLPGQEAAAARNLEARFSGHAVTPAQRRAAEGFTAEALAACKERWNPAQRFCNRWIRCIYL